MASLQQQSKKMMTPEEGDNRGIQEGGATTVFIDALWCQTGRGGNTVGH